MTTGTDEVNDIQVAIRHARLRWIGAPLLVTGGLLLVLALLQMVSGGPVWVVMFGLFGLGTALASFGANHDTAMAHAVRVRLHADLPVALRDEVNTEMARDRNDVMGLRPSAIAGLVVPLVCISVQTFVAWRLLGA
ncbi:MAG TPA: hypothetical protein DFR83_13690 [Deltaproteobacteria bacterium]|nr:hypothetical protein [Deltaproteobacteria bacterium]